MRCFFGFHRWWKYSGSDAHMKFDLNMVRYEIRPMFCLDCNAVKWEQVTRVEITIFGTELQVEVKK